MNLRAALKGRRLLIVGNVNRDLRTAPLPDAARLASDGETSTSELRETLGGGGANSAVAAAALGAEVTFVARVGADALGRQLGRLLRAHGVHPVLARTAGLATGTSLALAYADGHRHFVSCLPHTGRLVAGDVPDRLLLRQEHLLRADIWFSEPMLFGGNQQLLARAQQAGVATSIDLNWDPCWGVAGAAVQRRRIDAVRAVLPWVDVAHGNVRELCAFTGARTLARALAALSSDGVGAVVVHLGSRGAGWWDGSRLVVAPPVPPRRIVQHTGTGDLLSIVMMALHRVEAPPKAKLACANALVSRYMEGRLLQPAELTAVQA